MIPTLGQATPAAPTLVTQRLTIDPIHLLGGLDGHATGSLAVGRYPNGRFDVTG